MSWEVHLIQVPDSIKSASEMPDDYQSNLGPRPDIIRLLFQILPEMEWVEEWDIGSLRTEEYSIEILAGEKGDEFVDSITLAVRGRVAPISVIKHICDVTGWRALDTTAGEFMDFQSNISDGFNQWRNFVDLIMDKHSRSENEGDPQ